MSEILPHLIDAISGTCAGCERPGPAVCRRCRLTLLAASGTTTGQVPIGPDGTLVALGFTGPVRAMITSLKYRNRRRLAGYLAGLVVNRIIAAGLRPGIDIDLVTWAPTGAKNRRRRGFDQAEIVARRVAAQLGIPCRRLLERPGGQPGQTGRSRHERLSGPRFRASPRSAGRQVLVIDDVITTGATIASARRALSAAGAQIVIGAAIAATPARADRRVTAQPQMAPLPKMPQIA